MQTESDEASEGMLPSSRAEFVTAISHYYRGELSRMIAWRSRLDNTTNWAIAASAAMLSVTLASPDSHHAVILCCMGLVQLLLIIEARRYRFFDVSRRRVRLLERNYYARLFRGSDQQAQAGWRERLSSDLESPTYSLTLLQAMAARLRRNYDWIFLVLLVSWWLKVTTMVLNARTGDAEFVHSLGELIRHASVSYVPGWFVLPVVLVFTGLLLFLSTHYSVETTKGAPREVEV